MKNTPAFITLLFATIFTQQIYAQSHQANKPLNCDSTCLVADPSMLTHTPKTRIITAPTHTASPNPKPICGPSAGSILPSTPSSFLCSLGTSSTVFTTTANSETLYSWTCSTSVGTQACMATQREVGTCGSDNGKTLSNNPTNVCNSGKSTNFSFINNKYAWSCQGNYGNPAMCSAAYAPPAPVCWLDWISYGGNVVSTTPGGWTPPYQTNGTHAPNAIPRFEGELFDVGGYSRLTGPSANQYYENIQSFYYVSQNFCQ